MNILVVGATGQLGFSICEKLIHSKHQVKAAHRASSNTEALKSLDGIALVNLDLTEPRTFPAALDGVDVVISTANSATPRLKTDSFKKVDEDGLKKLIDSAKSAGVQQFIFVSALPFPKNDDKVPLSRAKRAVETHLKKSGMNYTIVQPTAFMEVYFPFFGSTIPLRGAKVNTLDRPFKFSNDFFAGIKNDIENKGVFNIIGSGNQKNAFISIENVADFCVASVGNPKALNRTLEIGGPENLTPLDIKAIFEELHDKPLKIKSTPPFVIKMMSKILPLFNPAAGNIMALNHVVATTDNIPPNAAETAEEFGVNLISSREFLSNKMKATA